jgi:OOP family OmpA-OmpF porin
VIARLTGAMLAVASAAGAGAAADERLIAVPPGMTALHDETRAPDRYRVPVRPVGAGGPVTEDRDGRVVWRSFRGPDPVTPLGAVEAASAPMEAAGFDIVLDCAARACGGFDFRLAIDVLPQPAMMVNPAEFHQRTLTGTAPDGAPVTVSLLGSRFGGTTHLQGVTVAGLSPTPVVDVPEAPDGQLPEARGTPAAMLAQLVQQGRVVLDGIDFDSAAVSKAAEGLPVLDTAATLLKTRPDLAVVIVGHSDNVGGLEANIRLSRARAAAVVDALVSRGVARDRLRAEGAGWLAPLSSNATPEGRAANRRVEMVLRN